MLRSICRLLGAAILLVAGLFLTNSSSDAVAPANAPLPQWQEASVPDNWRKTPSKSDQVTLFACHVQLPNSWGGEDLSIVMEGVDDAREVYCNGTLLGTLGNFPPSFRSGLGTTAELKIPRKLTEDAKSVWILVRCYYRDGRANFNVASPIIFSSETGIPLKGNWLTRTGDLTFDKEQWEREMQHLDPARATFTKTDSAAELRKGLKKLADEDGKQSPQQSLAMMEVPDDLKVELVLSEPDIAQPLSIKFDARGRMWVAEYRQYPHPAGLTAMSRDKFLRTVYDKLPAAPPNHFPGLDRISIHADSDGNGSLDQHSVFVDRLSLCSSFEFDRDGVWVLQPPYLLFYPDKNHDDQPDGDPEVHLEGFGFEDAHSVASNLRWGPDGWLYATQGSTVTGRIKRPGTDDKPIETQGQLVWRYHPQQRKYEVFAEGGGNAFGVEFDSDGRLFSGHNGGNTRGFHYVQGGYFAKSFGKHGQHSNPFTFGYLESMKHHNAPRFTHALLIYDDTALPSAYQGELLGVAPLQGHITRSKISPDGSTFQTSDTGVLLKSRDPWFRPVDIQLGPDGNVYIVDFYEQRIDHASHMQGRVDVESGRIYRIAAKQNVAPRKLESEKKTLLKVATDDPYRWRRQSAWAELRSQLTKDDIEHLSSQINSADDEKALRMLWLVGSSGTISDELAIALLEHPSEQVRKWSIRLACDDHEVTPNYAERLAKLASQETSPEVRSQMASSAARLPAVAGLPILKQLAARSDDTADPQLPLLIWWGVEKHVDTSRGEVLAMFSDREFWLHPIASKQLAPKLMKRLTITSQRRDLIDAAKLLRLSPGKETSLLLMAAMEEATQGKAAAAYPEELTSAIAATGVESPILKLRRRDPAAIQSALKTIADDKADSGQRMLLMTVLAQLKEPAAEPVLLSILEQTASDSLRAAALGSLHAFASDDIAVRVLKVYPQLADEQRQIAQSLLVSRQTWTLQLLEAIHAKKVDPATISEANVRRILLYEAAPIAMLAKEHLPLPAGRDAAALRVEIDRLIDIVKAGDGNPYHGKKLFAQTCGKCHTLFGEGGQVGPNLTSHHRDDLRGLLLGVVDPSAEVREGFETFLVRTIDGRTLTGYLADQDATVIVLRTAEAESISLARDEIEAMRALPQSLMPQGLLKEYSEDQLRDLLAYLRSTQPLP